MKQKERKADFIQPTPNDRPIVDQIGQVHLFGAVNRFVKDGFVEVDTHKDGIIVTMISHGGRPVIEPLNGNQWVLRFIRS